ncbi:MAG: TraX family protein [Anaerobutyricum hallii]|uniref:TraX family protein n=1 Tax=Anaerobutyricum hallii TaxID=39488 RepID=UPI00242BFC8F|nr:TraX family protein [Anaerobutyricum hallii]MDD6587299.1 TraX family protein [Anaerobutyricum hallii]
MNLKKISGYRLKYIALFSMLLDHIGVIGRAFLSKNVYFLLRAVGRLSFPLFCFILAEGFFHTKNRKKYQQRLFIFALLSEIPYDLAFHYLPAATLNSVLHLQKLSLTDFSAAFQEQNVLFTLFLGFTAMILMENASQYRQNAFYRNFDILIIFCCLSEVFQTDCGAAGILCIYFFYSIYKKRGSSTELPIKAGFIGTLPAALPLLTYVSPFPVQIFALADSLLLHCYNGEKGRGSKYFFYLFYPLHLLILIFIF